MSASGGRILLRTTTRNARRLWTGTALIAVHQACETFVPVLIGIVVAINARGTRNPRYKWTYGVVAALMALTCTTPVCCRCAVVPSPSFFAS